MTQTATVTAKAEALASRLEEGARALIAFAGTLTDREWRTPLSQDKDRRPIGVIVHHVASVYPLEIQVAQAVGDGNAITDVTWDVINTMNAGHAAEHANVTQDETIALLRKNSAAAAAAIRALSDEQLATAKPISLYENAPLTCQFFLEDHAVRHSYHHLLLMRRALGRD